MHKTVLTRPPSAAAALLAASGLALVAVPGPAHAAAPVAVADSYGVPFGEPLVVEAFGVLENDRLDGDPAGEAGAAVELVKGPVFGSLSCPLDPALALCPDGSFEYRPDASFSGTDSFSYRAVSGTVVSGVATVSLSACTGGPEVYACWQERAMTERLTKLGLAGFSEGFEVSAWDVARFPDTVAQLTHLGVSWTSNHPATNGISTAAGAARSGDWGVFDPDHGLATGTPAACDVDDPPASCLFGDGFSGALASAAGTLHGVGGYISGTTGANVAIVLDGMRQIGVGRLPGPGHQFFGVIDAGTGFETFSFREIDGKVGQERLIFGDDFILAVAVAPGSGPVLDMGEVPADAGWTTVQLSGAEPDVALIAGPPTFHGPHPGVVRLRNVGGNGFEVRFQEWDYRARDFADHGHVVEHIPYLALRPGRYLMADGSLWEVGKYTLGGTGVWQHQSFGGSFGKAPRLFLTVQSSNDPQAVTVRAKHVTTEGFDSALYEEEALMNGHGLEEVAYLAIESPAGSGLLDLGGSSVPYLLQRITADHRWVPVLSQRLSLQEEASRDRETWHAPESLDFLALDDLPFAQMVSLGGGDTAALRRREPSPDAPMEWGVVRGVDHNWQTLPFANTYDSPVVVAKPASLRGGQPGVVRIRDVGPTHARLRFQEWNYLDGWHAPEDIFYMVSEAGLHHVAGLSVEAGQLHSDGLARNGGWSPVLFGGFFPAAPVVLAGTMSFNGSDAVTTRIRDLSASGFAIAMDEQESRNDGHVGEALGWIAIEEGAGYTSDDRLLQTFFDRIDHRRTPVEYPLATGYAFPTLLADVDSTFGGDPVALRYERLDHAGILLQLSEEQSRDAETAHLLEDIGVFVGE